MDGQRMNRMSNNNEKLTVSNESWFGLNGLPDESRNDGDSVRLRRSRDREMRFTSPNRSNLSYISVETSKRLSFGETDKSESAANPWEACRVLECTLQSVLPDDGSLQQMSMSQLKEIIRELSEEEEEDNGSVQRSRTGVATVEVRTIWCAEGGG